MRLGEYGLDVEAEGRSNQRKKLSASAESKKQYASESTVVCSEMR